MSHTNYDIYNRHIAQIQSAEQFHLIKFIIIVLFFFKNFLWNNLCHKRMLITSKVKILLYFFISFKLYLE